MYNLLEIIFASKEFYLNALSPVCEKYELAHTELLILLCLAHNPLLNTATDIAEQRKLTKSAVSMAVRTLHEKGLIIGEHTNGNHRSIHLKVCDAARPIVEEGRAAQDQFFEILLTGFSDDEKATINGYLKRMTANINTYGRKRTD